jgi:predicted DNA-binding WGR domain protein
MGTSRFHLYFERRDASRNMARFYALSIERDLFGGVVLSRRWGRLSTRGRERQERFESERQALMRMLELCRIKRHRGYGPARPGKG